MIAKFSVSNDPDIYEAWPDLVQCADGRLVCVFMQCTHHLDRAYTQTMITESSDRGRTWSPKRPLGESSLGKPFYDDCSRITRMPDGRLVLAFCRVDRARDENDPEFGRVLLRESIDGGRNWLAEISTPMTGIVPDRLLQLDNGRLLLSAHHFHNGKSAQFLRYSDDCGRSWSDEVTVAESDVFNLCEGSLLPLGNGVVVCFMRENSRRGYDCKKVISSDNGEHWGPIVDFPLPGCHRPTAGWLRDGRILISYRFMQGGRGWISERAQNLFAAVTDIDSVLAKKREDAAARIMPVDFDRSPHADTGYSGWTQFDDGEIYMVNYIVDDAFDRAQIRGYSIMPEDFLLVNP